MSASEEAISSRPCPRVSPSAVSVQPRPAASARNPSKWVELPVSASRADPARSGAGQWISTASPPRSTRRTCPERLTWRAVPDHRTISSNTAGGLVAETRSAISPSRSCPRRSGPEGSAQATEGSLRRRVSSGSTRLTARPRGMRDAALAFQGPRLGRRLLGSVFCFDWEVRRQPLGNPALER